MRRRAHGLTSTLVLAATLLSAGEGSAEDNGAAVFERWCVGCHGDTPFAPGTTLLRQIRGADKAVIERRTDLPAAYIETLVRRGYAGMPSFRRTEISRAELDALVGYLTSGAGAGP